jgi:ABC-type lipoprotein release transport system permease subunit
MLRAMAVLALLSRAIWRHRVRSLVVLAVVGGIGLGIVMTAVAAARRADDAYTRLRAETLAPDALGDGSLADADLARLADAPEVAGIARFAYTPVTIQGRRTAAFVGLEPDFLRQVYRPLVRSGRLPRRAASDEVVINEALAKSSGLKAGQKIRLRSGGEGGVDPGAVKIVGVVRGIFDVGILASNPAMLLPSTYLDAHPDIELAPPNLVVRLVRGAADADAFERAYREVVGETPRTHPARPDLWLRAPRRGGAARPRSRRDPGPEPDPEQRTR